MPEFVEPKLDSDLIEFRCVDGEVALYFSRSSLERLISLMRDMSNKSAGHIHLQDYEILTPESLPAVLGLFE